MKAKPSPFKAWLILAVVVGALVYAAHDLEINPLAIFTADFWNVIGHLLSRMIPDHDEWGGAWDYAVSLWPNLAQTLKLAILATTIGTVLGLPVSFLAAKNVMMGSLRPVYWVVRSLLNLVRTVPDLVLAALFVGMFGIGLLPGILALSVFAFALTVKLLSESVEAVDPGPAEAIAAVGGTRVQQVSYAFWPQVMPAFLSYALYTLELNVRASFVLGLVGAGGIGQVLMTELHLFHYKLSFVIILVTLVAVVLVDTVSTRLRERVL